MFSATDWVLKRVLKTLLKKSIGRFLHSEPDLDQLDVQLATGTFELRNVLLNCDIVNAQLALHGWCITAGYIGLGSSGFVHQAAACSCPAAAAAAAAAPGGLVVWPVLLMAGAPLEQGRGLPAVARPSIILKVCGTACC
ncbi:hypothetical protein OEZ86_004661 [Tetradesmus obliquus]|nr:hypothetical protein OEZ86_004661 [Tetradesmus obliquus]